MAEERIPAEAFPLSDFIQEALNEKGWTWRQLALGMRGNLEVNRLSVALLQYDIQGLLLGEELATELSRLLGGSKEYWLNLDEAWQKSASGCWRC